MNLTQGLRRSMSLWPQREAVVFRDRRRTFEEFGARVAQFAAGLQSIGLKRGDRVAMLGSNSDRYLEYLFAVPWAGGVLNPVNTRWSTTEIAYSLNDSGSTILVYDDAFASTVGTLKAASGVQHLLYAGDMSTPEGSLSCDEISTSMAPLPATELSPTELAGIFYTGGTTGYPKGVMLSHENLLWHALAARSEGIGRVQDTYLHAAPMFHVTGFSAALFYWMAGSRHIVAPQFRPAEIISLIERERVTDIVLVPTMIQMLINEPAAIQGHMSSLKRIAYGGSPISETLIRRLLEICPGIELFQAYGMTETSGGVTMLLPSHHIAQGSKLRSAGLPLSVAQVRVIAPDGADVTRGQIGEVSVRAPNVMQGYWKREQETAAVLQDGWLKTGDAGYIDDDGFLFVIDRIKDMVVTGGENVYCVEVENALATHPAVSACAVIGIPDDQWGESVHAMIVRRPDFEVSLESLVIHCSELIASYKVPRSVSFIDSLPVSGAGKVLKHKLREPYWLDKSRKI